MKRLCKGIECDPSPRLGEPPVYTKFHVPGVSTGKLAEAAGADRIAPLRVERLGEIRRKLAAALADHAHAEGRLVCLVLRTRTHAPCDRIARCRPSLVESGRSRGCRCVEHQIPRTVSPLFVR